LQQIFSKETLVRRILLLALRKIPNLMKPMMRDVRQHAPRKIFLVALAAVAGVLLAAPVFRTADAGPLDPLNPFSSLNRPSTPEDRARKEQLRNELYNRLSPGYAMNAPFVSEQAVAGLEQAIQYYQRVVAAGGWPTVPEGTTLRLGDTSAAIAAIRRQLTLSGDLQGNERNPRFDQAFQEGLAKFQIRNGLKVSGFVDSRTLSALNVSAEERLQQLEANLSRVRSLLSIANAPRYILVNVPAYTLQAVEQGQLALESKVVVGKPDRATPVVSAKIVEVNFNPTWTVPESIIKADLIPKIRKDPSYFHNEHFSVMRSWRGQPLDPAAVDWNAPEVMNYKFVQDPGSFNALGLVRINMPNKHTVYLHDTPLKQLFNQSLRAFSSGCVRVERVFDVVAWLLAPQKWTPERVQATADGARKTDVKLSKPVPVHFVYITAFVSDSGVVQFRPDIYGNDAPVADELDDQNAVVAAQRGAITP
jgi:murein L,D-transpeptidase YcbB/YkuD